MEKELTHAGTRHSGRYRHGWGENPHQHCMDFRAYVYKLRGQGVDDKIIAKSMGMNTSQLRTQLGLADAEITEHNRHMANRLYFEDQYSKKAIAKRLGISESAVRNYLNARIKRASTLTKTTADILKDEIAKNKYVDVSAGVEKYLGIGPNRLKNAIKMLQDEGYECFNDITFAQLTTDNTTRMRVICAPGTQKSEVSKNKTDIKLPLLKYSEDGGETYSAREKPVSIDSSRVNICYAEDGGTAKDGVIELRRGVPDLSLGNARYAQVRIAVDDSHYLKGMAMYADDIPEGYDIRFNTNKHKGTPMINSDPNGKSVLKPMKNDKDNPFGARIRNDDELVLFQRHYIGEDGKQHLSALNVVQEEGNWNEWSKTLASQMLSKQPPSLAKHQLDELYNNYSAMYSEYQAVSNPTIRAKFLNDFADQCDRNAYELKAAALPRQSTKAILPVPELPDTDIYAPGYRDGEKVALIRYPHGGIFEIPVLTVNNKNAVAKNKLGEAKDAVGITPKTAEQLSGADFDGDTVLVLPVGNYNIRSRPPYRELIDFDPKSYKNDKLPEIQDTTKNMAMGMATNLITDMTIKGAKEDELIRAVKYSMVVIDSKKHHLDYKQAAEDFRIKELKEKYQGSAQGGSTTIISRATSPVRFEQQKRYESYSQMTPEEQKRWREGNVIYRPTNNKRSVPIRGKDGKVITDDEGKPVGWEWTSRYSEMPKMSTVDNAYDILRPGTTKKDLTRIEIVYADHANRMKELARKARSEARSIDDISYDASAAKTYSDEVKQINADISAIDRNRPLERQAQLIATKWLRAKKLDNPNLDKEHYERLKRQELEAARRMVGANRLKVNISDKQWQAIQAGAITKTKLLSLVQYVDGDRLRELAIPRSQYGMTSAMTARAKALYSQGHSLSDIAEALDVSPSTISKVVQNVA